MYLLKKMELHWKNHSSPCVWKEDSHFKIAASNKLTFSLTIKNSFIWCVVYLMISSQITNKPILLWTLWTLWFLFLICLFVIVPKRLWNRTDKKTHLVINKKGFGYDVGQITEFCPVRKFIFVKYDGYKQKWKYSFRRAEKELVIVESFVRLSSPYPYPRIGDIAFSRRAKGFVEIDSIFKTGNLSYVYKVGLIYWDDDYRGPFYFRVSRKDLRVVHRANNNNI